MSAERESDRLRRLRETRDRLDLVIQNVDEERVALAPLVREYRACLAEIDEIEGRVNDDDDPVADAERALRGADADV